MCPPQDIAFTLARRFGLAGADAPCLSAMFFFESGALELLGRLGKERDWGTFRLRCLVEREIPDLDFVSCAWLFAALELVIQVWVSNVKAMLQVVGASTAAYVALNVDSMGTGSGLAGKMVVYAGTVATFLALYKSRNGYMGAPFLENPK